MGLWQRFSPLERGQCVRKHSSDPPALGWCPGHIPEKKTAGNEEFGMKGETKENCWWGRHLKRLPIPIVRRWPWKLFLHPPTESKNLRPFPTSAILQFCYSLSWNSKSQQLQMFFNLCYFDGCFWWNRHLEMLNCQNCRDKRPREEVRSCFLPCSEPSLYHLLWHPPAAHLRWEAHLASYLSLSLSALCFKCL